MPTKKTATSPAKATTKKTPAKKTTKAVVEKKEVAKAPAPKAKPATKTMGSLKDLASAKITTTETPKGKGTHVKASGYFYGTGKRKTSIAQVRIYSNGAGDITVNGKPVKKYIMVKNLVESLYAPLRLTGTLKTFDISIKVTGGGPTGQADAIRHGIARALLQYDPSFRGTLKKAGFLVRDARIKERKKYGLHGARRAPQFAKR